MIQRSRVLFSNRISVTIQKTEFENSLLQYYFGPFKPDFIDGYLDENNADEHNADASNIDESISHESYSENSYPDETDCDGNNFYEIDIKV